MKKRVIISAGAALMVAVMLAIAGFEPAIADPFEPADPSRRPPVKLLTPVNGEGVEPRASVTDKQSAEMPLWEPAPVTWPEGTASDVPTDPSKATASRSVRSGLIKAGSLPVWIGSGSADAVKRSGLQHKGTDQLGAVSVKAHDRRASERLGVSGVVLEVRPVSNRAARLAGDLAVEVDYSTLAPAGGDWSHRARLVSLPACAVTTPERAECRTQTELSQSNDPLRSKIIGVAPPSQSTVMALTAGPSGSSGSFAATSLSATGSWSAGGPSGDFAWSHPFRVPSVAGDLMPELAASYSSQAVDGRTSSANNQPSWIGEGWDLSAGFIERQYKPCFDDMSSGANNSVKTGDLCWPGERYLVSFGAQSGELIRVGSTSTYRLRRDDGTRFEKIVSDWENGDDNRESWKVTRPDGTQYFFGRGKAQSGSPDTAATWTVPVAGNHDDEPCHEASFGASFCDQAWRWNLDYVLDVHGSSMTYYYTAETNNYGRNLNSAVSDYVRGGYLKRIDYGQRAGSEDPDTAPARVVFTTAERCLPTTSQDCSVLNAANAGAWPDVPQDQICTSSTSCAGQHAPTFFSRKRLTQIRTERLSGSTFSEVERWTLDQRFPAPADGTTAALWLQTITHAAAGGASPMPVVQFGGVRLANRVDGVEDTIGDIAPPLNKYRVASVKSESGRETLIKYSDKDCTPTDVPGSPETNTRRCFPVWWLPPGRFDLSRHYFHKYLVVSVNEFDRSGLSAYQVRKTFKYLGSPAWRYDSNPWTSKATWNEWAGYPRVQTITGDPASTTALRSETLYFRGLDGDRAGPSGGEKPVQVTDSEGVEVDDEWRLAGQARERITYLGPTGGEVTGTILDYDTLAETAGGSKKATLVGVVKSRTRTALSAGGYRRSEFSTSYDDYGYASEVRDVGDTAVTGDETCTRYTYARNTTVWILGAEATVKTRATACADWPSSPTAAQLLGDSRTYYDGLPLGEVTKGLPTKSEELTELPDTYSATAVSAYDALGRPKSVTNALGQTTSTTYSPTGAGILSSLTTTSADPDGPGPLTPHVSTTSYDARWGAPTKVVAPDGAVTETVYDHYGRATSAWLPGRPRSSNPSAPSVKYAYTTSATGPTAVTTDTLKWDGGYLRSIQIYDGLLRPRQTQTQSTDQGVDDNGQMIETVGRVVSEMTYDDRGLVITEEGPAFASGAPSTAYLSIIDAQVPQIVTATYDGASRLTKSTLLAYGQTKWSTSQSYGGDRVNVTPPAGATATTQILDVQGRTTALRQYLAATPTGTYEESKYRYSADGQLASLTDAAGNIWSYEYDLLGNLIKTNDPDAGTSSKTYDLGGQVITSKDARGETLAYTYDDLGRQTSVRDDTQTGDKRSEWVYDTVRKGYLTSSTRYIGGSGIISRNVSFDAAGNPTATEVEVPAITGWVDAALAKTYRTTHTYLADGTLDKTVLPGMGGLPAEEFDRSYDSLGRQKHIGGYGSYAVGAIYSAFGPLLQYGTGDGSPRMSWTTNTFDHGTGRLTETRFDRETFPKADYELFYSYNNAGALTKLRATHPQSGAAADTQCFSMDHLQRLTKAWTPSSGDCTQAASASTLGGPSPYFREWTFDKASNRKSQIVRSTAGDTTSTWAYPAVGQPKPHQATSVTVAAPGKAPVVSPVEHDAAGNVTERTVTAGAVTGATAGAETLTWNPEGRLSTASRGSATTAFIDDPSGNRLLRRDATTTTLYLGETEITLTRSTGAFKTNRYISFGGQTVAVRTGAQNADVYTLWSDLNNTATWQMSRDTNTIQTRRTLPYGEPRAGNTSFAGSHGFVDGLEDKSLGLVRVGAREYDPASGMFLSPDPLINTSAPVQWSPYTYGGGNPVIHPDPSGLMAVDGMGSSPADGMTSVGSSNHSSNSNSWRPRHSYRPSTGNSWSGGARSSGPSRQSRSYTPRPSGDTSYVAPPRAKPPADQSGPWWEQLGKFLSDNAETIGMVAGIVAAVVGGAIFCGATAGIGCVVLVGMAAAAVGYGVRVGLSEEEEFDAGTFAQEVAFGAIPLGGFGQVGKQVGKAAGKGLAGLAGKAKNLGKEVCGLRSFAAATLVLMADGTQKPIADVEVGDHVQATDPDTGKTTVQTVEHVWVHDDALYRLHLDNGETVGVTEDHPIYNKSARDWQDTKDLLVGDSLLGLRDDDLRVDQLESEPFAVDQAYNLTVTGPHTYHVGASAALVHNCPAPEMPSIKPGSKGGPSAGKKFPGSVRDENLKANPDVCVFCRMKTEAPQVDHALPRARGGNATPDNAQTTCRHCNASKGARPFPVTPPPGFNGVWPPFWW